MKMDPGSGGLPGRPSRNTPQPFSAWAVTDYTTMSTSWACSRSKNLATPQFTSNNSKM